MKSPPQAAISSYEKGLEGSLEHTAESAETVAFVARHGSMALSEGIGRLRPKAKIKACEP